MNNDALNPDSSPNGLHKKPKVKKMTKVPVLMILAFISLFIVIIIYVIAKKADKSANDIASGTVDTVEVIPTESVQVAGNFAEEINELHPDVNQATLKKTEDVDVVDQNSKYEQRIADLERYIYEQELNKLNGETTLNDVEIEPELTEKQIKAIEDHEKQLKSIREDKLSKFLEAVTSDTSINSGSGGGSSASFSSLNSSAEQIREASNERLNNGLARIEAASGSSGGLGSSLSGESSGNVGANEDDFRLNNKRLLGSPYELKTGSVITGVLRTGINSDIAGSVLANVSQDIYDTATGRNLLIPQGTQLYGTFNNNIANGQTRSLVRWDRLTFPDGSTLNLLGMIGSDREGYTGFKDKVNNHYFKIFGTAFLLSVFGTTVTAALPEDDDTNIGANNSRSLSEELSLNIATQFNDTASQIIERNLSIPPTLIQRSGYKFNILINKDIEFDSAYAPNF